jgi:two-component system phosphate regulon sensor histidine kinase PhoR
VSKSDGRTRRPLTDSEAGAPTRAHTAEGHLFTRELVERVNHHLRTPLTVVLCHAELLAEHEHDVPAAIHASHMAVLRAAQRLSDVVHGVCDLVATSVEPLTLETVGIPELVREEVHAYQDRAARRGVQLRVSAESTLPCITDPRRLRRALRELLDNAVTHAPDGSTVRVVSGSSADGVRIEVSDQGVTVEAADRERITRPFERGAHPRQPAAGRGMGLAQAVVLAASLGGRLLLAEPPAHGLQVCLELPFDVAHRDLVPLPDALSQW